MFDMMVAAGNQGLAWLTANAIFYDFSKIQAPTGTAIDAADTGIDDVGVQHVDGAPVNGILASNLIFNNKPVGCIVDTGDDAISIGQSAALKAFFRQSKFEVHILFHSTDGQDSASYNLMGVLNANGGYFNIYVEANGRINIGYATNSGVNSVNWQSVINAIPNGETTIINLRAVLDFDNNVITVYKDGNQITGAISAGTIATINPAAWDTAQNLYIGSMNNAGVATSNTNSNRFIRVALTPYNPPTAALNYFANPVNDALRRSQIHVTGANAAATRAALRTAIFGTYPNKAVPDGIVPVVSGDIHGVPIALLVNVASIDDLVFTKSGSTHHIYRIRNTAPNNKSFWYGLGHSPIGDEIALRNYLSRGYDVFFFALAPSGDVEDQSDNTQSGADWVPVSGGNHNEMASLGVSALAFQLFDVIECMNYVQANFTYTSHSISGTSGGGWKTAFVMALDERWTFGAPVRGVKSRLNKCFPSPYNTASDSEQLGSNGAPQGALYDLGSTYTYEDILLMGTTSGRTIFLVTNFMDTALLGDSTFNIWVPELISLAPSIGGGRIKFFMSTNAAEATHAVYQSELNQINTEL